MDFSTNAEEDIKIEKWQKKHIKKKHKGDTYFGAIGGNWSYEFIPTSIGDIGTVKCNCGEEFTFRELS